MYSFGSANNKKRVATKDLENDYIHCAPIFAGINLYVGSIYGKGFKKVESDSEPGAADLCNKIIKLPTFSPSAINSSINALVGGMGYMEQMWNEANKTIAAFKVIDPKTIKPKWNDFGQITKYVQNMNDLSSQNKEVTFKIFNDKTQLYEKYPGITNIKFQTLGDDPMGIGFIEPIHEDIKIYMDMKQSIKEILSKFAYPPIHVIKQGAQNKTEIETMYKDFKDWQRKSFFATSEKYSFNLVESKRTIPALSSQYGIILDSICSSIRVPKAYLFGRGESGTWGATMEAFSVRNIFEIELSQNKISNQIESQIFNPVLKVNKYFPNTKLNWVPLVEQGEIDKVKTITSKINAINQAKSAGLITDEKAIELFEDHISGW